MHSRLLRFIALFCLCLFAAAGVAGAAAPQQIPEATTLLVDEAGALTEGARKTSLARLRAFQDAGRAQIGVLVSKGTGGAPLAEYSSHWVFGLALLIIVPLGLFALILAVGGEDLQTRITQAAVGGGSIGGILLLAARYGLFAAVKVGLGGRFGGGGAGR